MGAGQSRVQHNGGGLINAMPWTPLPARPPEPCIRTDDPVPPGNSSAERDAVVPHRT